MPQTVLRVTRRNRWVYLFLFLLILGGTTWFISASFPRGFSSLHADPWALVLAPLMLVLWPLLLVHQVLFYWTYRLEFREREMQSHHVWNPFIPRLHCTYDDVIEVKPGRFAYRIKLVLREGKTAQIDFAGLEGGRDRLLEELARRIERDRFHASLQPGFEPDKRTVRFSSIFNVAWLVWLCLWIYTQIGHPLVLSGIAWNTAGRKNPLSFLRAFSLDPDGTPWLIVNIGVGSDRQVQHATADGVETWDLPAEGTDWSTLGSIQGIAHDDEGNPWVVYRKDLLHWTGESWQVQPGPLAKEGGEIWEYSLATYGSQLWAISLLFDNSPPILIQMDLNSGEW